MSDIRASVIIPTWNGCDMLLHALRSLQLQTVRDFEVIVVDNASTDGTQQQLAAHYPDVSIIACAGNVGFAAAVNAGIRAASADVIALLNNDTEADPRWLEALLQALNRYPQAGSCSSRMLNFGDRSRIDSIGVQLGLFASNIAHGESDGEAFAHPRRVFAACAGAAAYRRAVLDEIGLMDPGFFAYCEDVDLGVRLRLAGHDCVYVPEAVVYHRVSATADRTPDLKFYLLMRNALTLFFRYMPASRMVWAPAMLAWPFVRAIIDGQSQRTALRAVRDFLRQLPQVLETRKEWQRRRSITTAEFSAYLASPLARAGREPHLFAGSQSASLVQPPARET